MKWMNFHYVYLIQNVNSKELYIGCTSNLEERLKAHNNKGIKFTTRKSGRWIYIYAEAFRSKEDARTREKQLKQHGAGKRELLKRLQKSIV
jgi:putative endonuclease